MEAFCPQTCACGASRRDSACPRPYGRDCDDLANCLVWQGSHLCAPHTAITHGQITTLFTTTDAVFVEAMWWQINGALQYAMATNAQADMSTMIYWQYPAGSSIIGHFTFFQVDDTIDLDAIDARLYNQTTLAQYQQLVDTALAAQGVPVAQLGLQILVVRHSAEDSCVFSPWELASPKLVAFDED